VKAGLGLGSNVGDRLRHLQQARDFLQSLSAQRWLRASPVFETEPVDCPPGAGPFLNAVVEIEYDQTPRQLLAAILAYELAHGRDRSGGVNAPRPVDLDILYFGDQQLAEPDLIIPHPRLTQRRFVLLPLASIEPDLILAGTGQSVAARLRELPAGGGAVTLWQADW